MGQFIQNPWYRNRRENQERQREREKPVFSNSPPFSVHLIYIFLPVYFTFSCQNKSQIYSTSTYGHISPLVSPLFHQPLSRRHTHTLYVTCNVSIIRIYFCLRLNMSLFLYICTSI